MKENTNKSIAINSIILNIRLVIVSVCGLLYTRFSLQALGVTDYGLFSVIACIISFSSIINTIMVVTSNRFIAMAIGKGNTEEACRTFNVNLVIHLLIAMLTLVVALPIGHWYISNYVNYSGDMANVYVVFDISVAASAVSFVGVPYNGLLISRERFFVFCAADVVASVVKLVVTYLMIYHFEHKLLVYALVNAFMTAFPTVVFFVYCSKYFKDIVRFCFVREIRKYVEVLKFSAAVGYGAVALLLQTQGGALIINMFFNTAMNAGLAVANAVNNILQTFANNVQKPISPQIVKNYATGNMPRCTYLVCLASKATYLSMFMVSIPFLIIPESLLKLWLSDVPPYAECFTRLLIIDTLIFSINAGINDFVFATGRVKQYQLIVNSLVILSVIVGYFVIRHYMKAETLFYVYIAFSFIVFLVRPFILVRISHFDIRRLVYDSYIPVLMVTALFMPIFLTRSFMHPIACVAVAYLYFAVLVYFVALKKKERSWIVAAVLERFRRSL